MRLAPLSARAVILVLCALLLPGTALAQPQRLPIGSVVAASTGAGGTAAFEIEIAEAGLLTVMAYTAGDADLFLQLTDDVGQVLERSDRDLRGHMGAEAMSVLVQRPGPYRVVVDARGRAADFHIVASWLPAPGMEAPPGEADDAPSGAIPLALGAVHADSIDPSAGDPWDWFSLTLAQDALVTVALEAAEGDLALELYRDGDFSSPAERSDRDLEGVPGNEAITVRARAGETLHFKVVPVFSSASRIEYTIRAGAM